MSAEIMERYFSIKPEQTVQAGRYVRYKANGLLYTIVPVTHMEQEVLLELYEMSEHMAKHRDRKVSRFVAGDEGRYLATHENNDFVLLQNELPRQVNQSRTGMKLATFHRRGMLLNTKVIKLNRTGEWKELWGVRVDQMEREWSALSAEPPRENFDRLFLESFPYYMGLCENAIQYVIDTELDGSPGETDAGTICHQRFTERLWQEDGDIRFPFDWLLDHPARDLSEWMRDNFMRNGRHYYPYQAAFLREYMAAEGLSAFGWRLIYARLVFPLHYMETIENYYRTDSESEKKMLEERLEKLLRDAVDYERFLAAFPGYSGLSEDMLPAIKWLHGT